MDLSTEARQWHDKIKHEFRITDEAGLLLLRTAAESFDEMRNAQEAMRDTGSVYQDRFGQPKPHPAQKIISTCRNDMLKSLKQLGLEIEATI